jgi:hypothetical protein
MEDGDAKEHLYRWLFHQMHTVGGAHTREYTQPRLRQSRVVIKPGTASRHRIFLCFCQNNLVPSGR